MLRGFDTQAFVEAVAPRAFIVRIGDAAAKAARPGQPHSAAPHRLAVLVNGCRERVGINAFELGLQTVVALLQLGKRAFEELWVAWWPWSVLLGRRGWGAVFDLLLGAGGSLL